jgi:hypothetical protein
MLTVNQLCGKILSVKQKAVQRNIFRQQHFSQKELIEQFFGYQSTLMQHHRVHPLDCVLFV